MLLARRLPISLNVNFLELHLKFFGNLKLKFTYLKSAVFLYFIKRNETKRLFSTKYFQNSMIF